MDYNEFVLHSVILYNANRERQDDASIILLGPQFAIQAHTRSVAYGSSPPGLVRVINIPQ
jgi:hypothetical protein